MISIAVVSIDTVGNGEAKRLYSLTSSQFNAATTWLRALFCGIIALILEFKMMTAASPSRSACDYQEFVQSLLLSSFAAVGVNILSVAIIGRVSAVGYSVLGHCKTIIILLSGGVTALDSTQLIGIFLAVFGSGLYSHQTTKQKGEYP